MTSIVVTLVFSVAMLVFMAFPAMKIVEAIENIMPLTDRWRNVMVILMTILLSLLIGLFLRYA